MAAASEQPASVNDCAPSTTWRHAMRPVHWWAAGLLAAGYAALAVAGQGASWILVALIPLAALGGALSVIDMRSHLLPNVLVLPGIGIALCLLLVVALASDQLTRLLMAIAWAGGLFFAFAALAAVSPASLGFGDVKLIGLLALFAGWFGPSGIGTWLLVTFVGAGLVAVGLLVSRRATRSTRVAFGPYLIVGLFLTLTLV